MACLKMDASRFIPINHNLEIITKKLKQHNINFDVVGDKLIRVYCWDNGNDFTTIRITQEGEIAIDGRIADFEEWLNR